MTRSAQQTSHRRTAPESFPMQRRFGDVLRRKPRIDKMAFPDFTSCRAVYGMHIRGNSRRRFEVRTDFPVVRRQSGRRRVAGIHDSLFVHPIARASLYAAGCNAKMLQNCSIFFGIHPNQANLLRKCSLFFLFSEIWGNMLHFRSTCCPFFIFPKNILHFCTTIRTQPFYPRVSLARFADPSAC